MAENNIPDKAIESKNCVNCENPFPLVDTFWYRSPSSDFEFLPICKLCVLSHVNQDQTYYRKTNEIHFAIYKYRKIAMDKEALKHKGKSARARYNDLLCTFNSSNGRRLLEYEKVRMCVDLYHIEVACAYCGKWVIPTTIQATSRTRALNNMGQGESLIYCSDGCKYSCPVFHKQKHHGVFKSATSRESNPLLRQLVLKRDNYTCQKCGTVSGGCIELHCHHVVPAAQNPMTANDPDVCVTLCKECHKATHKTPGCGYHELRCATKL